MFCVYAVKFFKLGRVVLLGRDRVEVKTAILGIVVNTNVFPNLNVCWFQNK